ncbi:hypothetical protein [Stappia sp. ES.058]|uniref:hypothetical protein n=1 Tax=Stappia sp. ES.058 TaxID=1881061 RepID=UPI00087BB2D9|nr:hypothetical protein [Stappia sp. ES.058]SDU05380.1 hypothetical protein SAMN05428979_1358 [Stappia sp. ES.058]
MQTKDSGSRSALLDRPAARLSALVVAGLAVLAIVWIGRVGFAGVALTPFEHLAPAGNADLAGNPELAACLQSRVGAVDQMRSDGVIDDAQYDTFKTRAVSYCQAQFPPQ